MKGCHQTGSVSRIVKRSKVLTSQGLATATDETLNSLIKSKNPPQMERLCVRSSPTEPVNSLTLNNAIKNPPEDQALVLQDGIMTMFDLYWII